VAAADLDVGAHEAAQQQRRDVALRRREPPGELGVVGGREVDGVRLQLALLLDRVDRVLVGLRRLDPRLRAASASFQRPALASSSSRQPSGSRPSTSSASRAATSATAGRWSEATLSTPRNVPFGWWM
jgi:hypothetical protein